jgi:hypothetical protein
MEAPDPLVRAVARFLGERLRLRKDRSVPSESTRAAFDQPAAGSATPPGGSDRERDDVRDLRALADRGREAPDAGAVDRDESRPAPRVPFGLAHPLLGEVLGRVPEDPDAGFDVRRPTLADPHAPTPRAYGVRPPPAAVGEQLK